MKPPIKQHYVPRFLLDRFTDAHGFLRIKDKRTEKCWKEKPVNAFVERRFNVASHCEFGALNLESRYTEIETYAAPVIRRIIDGEAPRNLQSDDRVTLAIFMAVQLLRSPNWRASQIARTRQMRSLFPDGRMPETIVKQIGTLTNLEARYESIALVMAVARDILPYLLNKFFFVSTAYPGTEFLIGDSPVVLYNSIESPHYGNLGLEVPGCELHMPISSTVMITGVAPALAAEMAKHSREIQMCIERGKRIRLVPENMLFQNSLQIRWSERLVAGQSGDFSLVDKMISDNPAYREGMRMRTYRGNDPLPEVHDWSPTIVTPSSVPQDYQQLSRTAR